MANLSSKAMIAILSVSQWQARKYDRSESAAVAQRHGTSIDIARVNKSLLPMANSLSAVHKATNVLRTEYYRMSLPWSNGEQIIRSDQYFDFTRSMRPHIDVWWTLVHDFLAEYEPLRDQAQTMLNGLYREEDYPDLDDVRRKFDVRLRFKPVPEGGDWRVGLSDEEIKELRQQVEDQVVEAQGDAMREAWRRVHDVVSHAHERLSDPNAIFRDSLVENAKELCLLLPKLNIADDPQLENTRRALERALCSHNPDTLRSDTDARKATAAKLAEIQRKMGAFYG